MNVPRGSNANKKDRDVKRRHNFFQTIRQGDKHWSSQIVKRAPYQNLFSKESKYFSQRQPQSASSSSNVETESLFQIESDTNFPINYNPCESPAKKIRIDQFKEFSSTESTSSQVEHQNLDFFNLQQLSKTNSTPKTTPPNIFPFQENLSLPKSPEEVFYTPSSFREQNFDAKETENAFQNFFQKPDKSFSFFTNKNPGINLPNENVNSNRLLNVFGEQQIHSSPSTSAGFSLNRKINDQSSFNRFQIKPNNPASAVSIEDPASYDGLFTNSVSSRCLPQLSTPLFQTNSVSATSKSKVSTSKSRTTSKISKVGTSDSSFVVVAITEGRGCATGEVGIASIDLKNPILTLCQLSDYQTYIKTITKLHLYEPAEIVFPDTFEGANYSSDLFKRLSSYFNMVRLVSVKRQFFSGQIGIETLRSLCLAEYSSVELITLRKFYALAALSALIKYVEYEHNVLFCQKSIKVVYECASGTVSLETASRLELVLSQSDMVSPEKYSLFGTLNNTVTIGGKRRLRSEILQPFSTLEVIEERLNIVSCLINDRPFLSSIQAVLEKFTNVERLLWLCKKPPNFKHEQKTSEILTSYILILKNTLENVPMFRDLLSESQENFFTKIHDMLSDNRFEEMKQLVEKTIHPDAKPCKGYQATEMSRCFSIKDNINGLLDVARSTYSKLINEVQDIIIDLATQHELPLKMGQTSDFGFHALMQLNKKDDASNLNFPDIFTDIKQKGNVLHLSTDEIFSYNDRIRRVVQEIQIISNIVLNELVEELKPKVGCLYVLCEKVAELDVVCSLAKASCSNNYTRPYFGDVLDIKAGRHPILDYHQPTKPIPNDIYASKIKNFNIITGPNMGGKTIYALQAATLQIIAQIGCFIPADSAKLRLTDQIYVRKGGLDSIELGGSSFTMEIKELTYILNTLTDTSLLVLDELCTGKENNIDATMNNFQGTSNEGGTAIAWGLCEEFLKKPIFTFLTTHYHYLTNLERIFTNVTNYHLEAIDPGGEEPLTFTYRLQTGVTDITNYGIKLMMTTSLPESLKENAIKIINDLLQKRARSLPISKIMPEETLKVIQNVDELENFMKELYILSKSDNFSNENVQKLQMFAKENLIHK